MFMPTTSRTAGPELTLDHRLQRAAPEPYSKKNNPGDIIQLAGVQSFSPGIKNGDHVVRRKVRVQNNLTQFGGSSGDLLRRIDVMNKFNHGSSRHSIHRRGSFALNIPATSEFHLGDPARKTETEAPSSARATIISNHLGHIIGKQQVAWKAGRQSIADLTNPLLPSSDWFER